MTLSLVPTEEEAPAPEPVVAAPIDEQPLDDVPAEPGRVVVVFSPKGGAGTTTIATNLALGLARGGERSVCLVDLDLEFGDVAILTGVAPSRTIVDAVGLRGDGTDEAADDDVLTAATSTLPSGLHGILAPIDPAAAEAVSPALVGRLLVALRARYEFVVVDTPCSLGELVLEALDVADHHVVVTTAELPALKNARLVLDTLDLLDAGRATRHVVLNQAGRAGLDAAGVAEALRFPVALTLPIDPAVSASIAEGRPLLARRRPAGSVAAVLREFATTIAGEDVAVATTRRMFRRAPRTRQP